jgi:hypothetical protein
MAKVDIELVRRIMQRNALDIQVVSQVINDLESELEIEAAENPKPPPVKKQFVVLVSDPEGHLEGKDFAAWVCQIPEEDPPMAAEERIHRAAYEFNLTPKGRRLPARTIGEACEAVPARLFKEQNIWVKTKEAVLACRTNNEIPMDDMKKAARE